MYMYVSSTSFQIGFVVIVFMNIRWCKYNDKFVVCSFSFIKDSTDDKNNL